MITRRTLLSQTAPAIGALGAAVMAAPSLAGGHPDAELLALDAACDAILPVCRVWATKVSEAQDAVFAEVLAGGQTLSEASDEIVARLAHVEDPCQRAWEEYNRIEASIRESPAATLAGLAVKARMVRRVCSLEDDTQGPEEDWDWDKSCLELFLREVERMAGEA